METLNVDKNSNNDVNIRIRFKSPATNNNGDQPAVDHIQLIVGQVTGKVSKFLADGVTPNPAYVVDTNASTHLEHLFTAADWSVDTEGWTVINYTLEDVTSDMYFRIRGTNLGLGVVNQTDAFGSPLSDSLMGSNSAAKAWADLWFYSNPVFINAVPEPFTLSFLALSGLGLLVKRRG